jgi:hypothetical protein
MGIRDKLDEEIITFWPKHLAIAHFQGIVDAHTARAAMAWEKVSMFRATEAAWHERIAEKYLKIIEGLK